MQGRLRRSPFGARRRQIGPWRLYKHKVLKDSLLRSCILWGYRVAMAMALIILQYERFDRQRIEKEGEPDNFH